ncbi:MAG: hypothetical protein QM758_28300 [Armatimonas sp.]
MRWLPALAALLLLGCGGGGGTDYLTRETEATLDRDALVLASREATGLRIPLSLARQIDSELRDARAAFASLQTSHARQDSNPRVLHIIIAENAPWRATWESGQWRTGVAAIDEVLTPLNVASVRTVSVGDGRAIFDLTFDQWVRTKAVAFTLYDKSPAIQSVNLVPATEGTDTDDLAYSVDNGTPVFSSGGMNIRRVSGAWQEIPAES